MDEQQQQQQQTIQKKRSANDFELLDTIGEGSYSTVIKSKDKLTGKLYAMKVLDKRHIVKEKKIKYINIEKAILHSVRHPFILKLYYTFQDTQSLYFCLQYAEQGELLHYIRKLGCFDLVACRFYIAEILIAVQFLHSRGVLHRDLKPENILLNKEMHILIADFGSAKIYQPTDPSIPMIQLEPATPATQPPPVQSTRSFVGTAEYVSPELLNDLPAVQASDVWAIGCILYQLISGKPPFKGPNEYQTFQKIIKLDLVFPDGFATVAKHLITQILKLDPTLRFTIDQILTHDFFTSVEFVFDQLWTQTPPSLEPYCPPSTTTQDEDVVEPNTCTAPYSSEPVEQRLLALQAQKEQANNLWRQYVTDTELIVKSGFVAKRRGLFSKKRYLILTDSPRLVYVDAEKQVVKGEILFSPRLIPELKSKRQFFIHTPGRTYYMECLQTNAKAWVDTLNQVRAQINQSPTMA